MQLILIGKIGKPHGFQGAFVTQEDAGRDSALNHATVVYVGRSPDSAAPYTVEEAAWMPKGWKLKLRELSSDTQVKGLVGAFLYVDRATLPQTESDEYYVGDLEGLDVREQETGVVLGKLLRVETAGPGTGTVDRWWIGSEGGSFAIPATKRHVERVDLAARTVWLKNLGQFK